jgi:hypothetical protein
MTWVNAILISESVSPSARSPAMDWDSADFAFEARSTLECDNESQRDFCSTSGLKAVLTPRCLARAGGPALSTSRPRILFEMVLYRQRPPVLGIPRVTQAGVDPAEMR